MKTPLTDKRILLGATGSIAAYKAADLASKLAQMGAQVDVILTQSAAQFVTPLTFQSVTGRRAYTDADLWASEGHVLHIGLARPADILVIAPASANTLAKLAHGMADNLLSVTALAAACPVLIAPAMDGGMFAHPATQGNLETLRQRGVWVVGPAEGHLASGMSGVGRMVEPGEILGAVRLALSHGGPLTGSRIVVTAGGTQEPIDPVRIVANRSSGKQGYALAQAALDLGADVTLISTPVHLPPPAGARLVRVQTAAEMHQAVLEAIPQADGLVMAAAVADFTPESPAGQKIKKQGQALVLQLRPTIDILTAVADYRSRNQRPRITVGFAAESENLLDNARTKMAAKNLDMIVANDIRAADAGFEVDTNRVTLLFRDGTAQALPLMSKEEVAQAVMERTAGFLQPERNAKVEPES